MNLRLFCCLIEGIPKERRNEDVVRQSNNIFFFLKKKRVMRYNKSMNE